MCYCLSEKEGNECILRYVASLVAGLVAWLGMR